VRPPLVDRAMDVAPEMASALPAALYTYRLRRTPESISCRCPRRSRFLPGSC